MRANKIIAQITIIMMAIIAAIMMMTVTANAAVKAVTVNYLQKSSEKTYNIGFRRIKSATKYKAFEYNKTKKTLSDISQKSGYEYNDSSSDFWIIQLKRKSKDYNVIVRTYYNEKGKTKYKDSNVVKIPKIVEPTEKNWKAKILKDIKDKKTTLDIEGYGLKATDKNYDKIWDYINSIIDQHNPEYWNLENTFAYDENGERTFSSYDTANGGLINSFSDNLSLKYIDGKKYLNETEIQNIEFTFWDERLDDYILSDSEFKQADKKARKKLDSLKFKGTTVEKARAIHDWVIMNCKYKENAFDQTMYGVAVHKEAVCNGYAETYKYLCDRHNIPCKVAFSNNIFPDDDYGKVSHAWNLVKVDGKWYNVDCCWDDMDYGIKEFGKYIGNFCPFDKKTKEVITYKDGKILFPDGSVFNPDMNTYDYFLVNDKSHQYIYRVNNGWHRYVQFSNVNTDVTVSQDNYFQR